MCFVNLHRQYINVNFVLYIYYYGKNNDLYSALIYFIVSIKLDKWNYKIWYGINEKKIENKNFKIKFNKTYIFVLLH